MTDNIIEKIKADVERLKDSCASPIVICDTLLSLIDSLQEEPKKCMYALDDFNDEDRKVTCGGCEEDCKYAKLNAMLDDALSKETKESWNERLGKEKPKFKVGDRIRKINDGLEAKVTSVDNSGYIYAACEDWELVEEPVSENLEE